MFKHTLKILQIFNVRLTILCTLLIIEFRAFFKKEALQRKQ